MANAAKKANEEYNTLITTIDGFDDAYDKIQNIKQPFFLQMATLASHGPFDIDKKYRELDLPEEIDKSYLGGYFESLHYADKQIEMFFNKLKEDKEAEDIRDKDRNDHQVYVFRLAPRIENKRSNEQNRSSRGFRHDIIKEKRRYEKSEYKDQRRKYHKASSFLIVEHIITHFFAK